METIGTHGLLAGEPINKLVVDATNMKIKFKTWVFSDLFCVMLWCTYRYSHSTLQFFLQLYIV